MRRAARVVTVSVDAGVVEIDGWRAGRRWHERFMPDVMGTDMAIDPRALRAALRGSRMLAAGVERDVRVVWETSAVGYRIGAPQASPSSVPPARIGHTPAGTAGTAWRGPGLLAASVPTCCPPGNVRHAPCFAPPLEVIVDAAAVSEVAETLAARRCAGAASLEVGPLVRARALLQMDDDSVRGDLIVLDVARAATTLLRCISGSLVAIRGVRGDGRAVLVRMLDALLSDGAELSDATRVVVQGTAASEEHAVLMSELVDAAVQHVRLSR